MAPAQRRLDDGRGTRNVAPDRGCVVFVVFAILLVLLLPLIRLVPDHHGNW
jgi:hypothetical protein